MKIFAIVVSPDVTPLLLLRVNLLFGFFKKGFASLFNSATNFL